MEQNEGLWWKFVIKSDIFYMWPQLTNQTLLKVNQSHFVYLANQILFKSLAFCYDCIFVLNKFFF